MNIVLPGCYSFKEEFQMFLSFFKEEVDSLIYKIYKLDSDLRC